VAQTKPRVEERVVDLLRQERIDTFLPRLAVRHRHGSRRWWALEPLFPGYVFVACRRRAEEIRRVRWTAGIRRLLGEEEGGFPTPVPDEVIRLLQERTQTKGFILPEVRLTPGERVRFTSGPLALIEGIIDRPASRTHRVRVLLQLLHGCVAVEADIDEVELIVGS
jgi:transcriptional antiterminator RfaH